MPESEELSAAWGEWVTGLREWSVFGGLTFDQRRFREYRVQTRDERGRRVEKTYKRPEDWRMPKDLAVGRYKKWVRQCESYLGSKLEHVTALEYQRNGWPHFHPLLHVPGLKDGDIASMGQLWYEANGYAKLEPPRDALAVASYASKYLVKDLASGDVIIRLGPGNQDWQTRL